ncbi:hypothetical protein OIDMADRAFT_30676 [Oidiodendron maius Zn]|uniref:Uncharacterized protein n=1 Tax=Oidiodendron maius (strain Zn) TaxID=913774 RepID=A0A0C3DAS5_OIDMZ|nr:hypothetical protein OIDMADRAFT_30676 [Oidiodendron maius Zn]
MQRPADSFISYASLRIVDSAHAQAAPQKNLVLYGLEATGKSAIVQAVLEALASTSGTALDGHAGEDTDEEIVQFAIVKSAESITGRHLLEQTVGSVAKAVDWKGKIGRCESLAQFVVELGRILNNHGPNAISDAKQRFVLVFDGIDSQREPPPTLLPALARLGEMISNLTTVFIVTAPRPNFLHFPGTPHIHFPPYTKQELLQILSLTTPSPKFPGDAKATKDVWSRFTAVVWDSLAKHSGRDILSMRSVCLRLWPRFIAPVLEGTHSASQFSRLLLANRSLFQSDSVLVPSIIADPPTTSTHPPTSAQGKMYQGIGTQLPYYSRLLLVAAYLASFNPPRTDQIFFMKAAAAKRRKKGGATVISKIRPGVSRHRKISRKLLGPQAFVLERMLAIFHAIKDDADSKGRHGKGKELTAGSADIEMGIATLVTLRLLAKVGSTNAGDALEAGTKYRVAVGWEMIRGVARSVGVEAEDYLFE